MKILFLDCDGVLNSQQTFIDNKDHKEIDPMDSQMVERVQRIVKETKCKVVLSSTWRNHADAKQKVHKVIPIYDVTPRLSSGIRGDEIQAYLDLHKDIRRYACLDDDSDFYSYQHLFKTQWLTGLTDVIAQKVIDYLNCKHEHVQGGQDGEDVPICLDCGEMAGI